MRENKEQKKHNSQWIYAYIERGVPKGPILNPLLVNINICNMFFENNKCDITT